MAITFKVSKIGEDALVETDPNKFIFDSDHNTFKILAQGTFGGSVTAGTTTFTLAHGQSITPAVFGFAKFPDGYVALPTQKPRDEADPVQRWWDIEIDSGTAHFSFYKGTSANYGIECSYYIFETPLA